MCGLGWRARRGWGARPVGGGGCGLGEGAGGGGGCGLVEAAGGRRDSMVLLAGRRVVAAPERRRSAERGDRAQARERVGECLRPWPVGLESQAGAGGGGGGSARGR